MTCAIMAWSRILDGRKCNKDFRVFKVFRVIKDFKDFKDFKDLNGFRGLRGEGLELFPDYFTRAAASGVIRGAISA